MHAEGWYRDPYGLHDDRWFSDGRPTNLVRDQFIESHDEPPQPEPPHPFPPAGASANPTSGISPVEQADGSPAIGEPSPG